VVLNAKNDAEEAAIVARAGEAGAVTISTNMAGRGTDIRLGGEHEEERERVASLGGLYVIGTNRHESRRIDLQLRGRSGRQGDPGESRFFVSLEDDLLVRYGICGLLPARFFERSDAPVDNPIVLREVARAQRIVEGQNFEMRKTLARYSAALEQQHRLFLERRSALLDGDLAPDVWERAPQRRAALVAAAGEDAVVAAERAITLACLDRAWRDHLARCADLRDGIHLVRLGGRDPLTAFTSGAIESFARLDDEVDEEVLAAIEQVRPDGTSLDLSAAGPKAPSSTWTYLVNDDPFERRFGTMLTGPGGVTVAMYSAAVLAPLLIAWGMVERLFGKKARRRLPPSTDAPHGADGFHDDHDDTKIR
jgi:preprotein translocase subunit SecA